MCLQLITRWRGCCFVYRRSLRGARKSYQAQQLLIQLLNSSTLCPHLFKNCIFKSTIRSKSRNCCTFKSILINESMLTTTGTTNFQALLRNIRTRILHNIPTDQAFLVDNRRDYTQKAINQSHYPTNISLNNSRKTRLSDCLPVNQANRVDKPVKFTQIVRNIKRDIPQP